MNLRSINKIYFDLDFNPAIGPIAPMRTKALVTIAMVIVTQCKITKSQQTVGH